jgi:hypothetical protein
MIIHPLESAISTYQSPLTIYQVSAQPDTISPPKTIVYKNCSILKLQLPELTKPLSILVLYSTNPQSNWTD